MAAVALSVSAYFAAAIGIWFADKPIGVNAPVRAMADITFPLQGLSWAGGSVIGCGGSTASLSNELTASCWPAYLALLLEISRVQSNARRIAVLLFAI